jgi:hypothetical protein
MAFQLPSDQLITTAFCSQGTVGVDYVLPPLTGSEASNNQTQQYGIPPVQAEVVGFGGLPVLRSETNGTLQFYSNVLNFINKGGQFTFDATQSTAIGGYSQGAVLFDFATSTWQTSLINNNTNNFVSTRSFYNDGINWATTNQFPSINNPTANNLRFTVTSTVDARYSLNDNITQLSTSDVTNGLIQRVNQTTNAVTGATNYIRQGWDLKTSTSQAVPRTQIVNQYPGGSRFFFDISGENPNPNFSCYYLDSTSVVQQGIEFDSATSPYLLGRYAGSATTGATIVWKDLLTSTVSAITPTTRVFTITGISGGIFQIDAISFTGTFPTNKVSISGSYAVSLSPGSLIPGAQITDSVDLIAAGLLSSYVTQDCYGSISWATVNNVIGGNVVGSGLSCSVISGSSLFRVRGLNSSNPASNLGGTQTLTFSINLF